MLLVGVAASATLAACAGQDPTAAFAQDMAAHHAQAVEMATLALTRMDAAQDAELWAISTDIVLTQSNQLGRLQTLLEQDGQPLVPSGDHGHAAEGIDSKGSGHASSMPGMASPEDVAAIATLPKEQALAHYVDLMIEHHKGGVLMAQEALKAGVLPPAERLASSIVSAQTGEIVALEAAVRNYQ